MAMTTSVSKWVSDSNRWGRALRSAARLALSLLAPSAFTLACGGQRLHTSFSPHSHDDQIVRGRDLYDDNCAGCHGSSGRHGDAPPLAGPGALPKRPPPNSGMRETPFESARDVANFVVEQMPPGRSGRLSIEEHYAILAYLLNENAFVLDRPLSPETASAVPLTPKARAQTRSRTEAPTERMEP